MRPLGPTGLHIGRLALGTMTWGRGTEPEDAALQVRAFIEGGGTLIDTADVYADGLSEEILGHIRADDPELLRDAVIATKAVSRPGAARRFDASRRHLLAALDGSLQRLRVDHVDLWQLHAWDGATPLDETLAAVEVAVTSGRVRYAGISNYSGWQTAAAAQRQRDLAPAAPIVSSQMEYSLLQRGVEREVVPACAAYGIGILPWSPLGRGVLTGKYRHTSPPDSRATSEFFRPFVAAYLEDRYRRVVEGVCLAADGLGVSPTEVALAWVRDRPGVVAPVVGARTVDQVRVALSSEDLVLPDEIADALDDVSTPAMGYPEHGWNQR